MDDDRLKDLKKLGSDYFDEQLEIIRDIKVTEKNIYIKLIDIYATALGNV